jgi:hypothetical protein
MRTGDVPKGGAFVFFAMDSGAQHSFENSLHEVAVNRIRPTEAPTCEKPCQLTVSPVIFSVKMLSGPVGIPMLIISLAAHRFC